MSDKSGGAVHGVKGAAQAQAATAAVSVTATAPKRVELDEGLLRGLPIEEQDLAAIVRLLAEERLGLSAAAAGQIAKGLAELLVEMAPDLKALGRGELARAGEAAELVGQLARVAREAKGAADVKQRVEGEVRRLEQERNRLFKVLWEEIGPIEEAVRGINLFFDNTRGLSTELAERPQLHLFDFDLTDPATGKIDDLRLQELDRYLDRENFAFQIERNLGILLAPGTLGLEDRKALEALALKMGMILISDLDDFSSVDDLVSSLETAENEGQGLVRNETQASTSIVAGPYLLARDALPFEEDGLWMEPSWALAGMMSRADRSAGSRTGFGLGQPAAGEKDGRLKGALATRYEINQSDYKKISRFHVNPIYRGTEKNLVVSTVDTLCTDDQFRQYQARRVIDYVGKLVAHAAWKLQGRLLDKGIVQTEFGQPVRELLDQLSSGDDRLLSGFRFEPDYDDAKLAKGILHVNLAVKPTMVTDTIQINLSKSLDRIPFGKRAEE